jgi:hypothetical protein
MTMKLVLTLVLLVPLLVLATVAFAGDKVKHPVKAPKYDTAGRAMTVPMPVFNSRNDVIHRYRGGPKYPH